MASISTNAKGLRRLKFTWANASRTLHLGRLPLKASESLKFRIDGILAIRALGIPFDIDTCLWIRGLSERLHGKLAQMGLVPPRPRNSRLLPFINTYIESRTDWALNSRRNALQARGYVAEFFDGDKMLDSITEYDAKAFRRFMGGRVGENTARRNCKWARQFFQAAVDMRIIGRNPFAPLRGLTMTPSKNLRFIPRETVDRVIKSCPDIEWKLIVALARYGGLRCPTETLALKLADIDWEANTFTVNSTKTGIRVVPIFPELRPLLAERFDGITNPSTPAITSYRERNNLRTQLLRILGKAGVERWPKLYQNLRASRETELVESFPTHVACKWIGNSQLVAMRHYLLVTEAHYRQAAGLLDENTRQVTDGPCPQ